MIRSSRFSSRRTGRSTPAVRSGLATTANSSRLGEPGTALVPIFSCPLTDNASNVPMSKLESGQYTLVIQADNSDFAVQRKFTLTIGSPEKTVVVVRLDARSCRVVAELTVEPPRSPPPSPSGSPPPLPH